MCDPGFILGIASGAASAIGEAEAADANMDQSIRQAKLEHAAQEQERLIQIDGANKEGYQAQLEGDRTASAVRAMGEGMGGATAGQRVAEQSRQTALSIENAKDRKSSANANYVMAGKSSQITAQNDINRQAISPMSTFFNIAGTGVSGYGTLGDFPSGNTAKTPAGRFN
ncbi:virion core protein, T7 gp14 family [Shinella zoogloeoides]|uniref:virion core protein, T7 gp14 family n=1 Tax=Shinella zoogloeoides TaxID=352475 RepID=UPI000E65A1C2|nr:hypothetical protein [Shinella zoogloeoides]